MLLAVGFVAVAGAAPAPAAIPSDWHGINATGLFGPAAQPTWDAVATQRPHQGLGTLGVTHARVDMDWAQLEPERDRFDWRVAESRAVTLAQLGIRWSPVLAYSPEWASTVPGVKHAPPADIARFARMAAEFAERFGTNGSWWADVEQRYGWKPGYPIRRYEIWNEPNLRAFWQPEPDAGAYADLFVAASDAIKGVDAQGQVIVGGLYPGDAAAFISAMAAARADTLAKADGVGYHPYAATVEGALGGVRRVRQTLARHGQRRLPIYVSEVGWPTRGSGQMSAPPLPDATRAGNLTLLADALANSDCRIASFEPFTWVALEEDPADDEHWLGIWSRRTGATATSAAYARLIARHRKTPPRARLRICARGSRPTSRPLPLRLAVRRSRARCVSATVRYYGLPVAGIRVEVSRRDERPVTIRTDAEGVARGCHRRRGALKARARLPRAAESRWTSVP